LRKSVFWFSIELLKAIPQQNIPPGRKELLWNYALLAWRILKVSFKKFLEDGCLVRANAIAYSILISFIPFLTVLIKFAEVDQETIRANLARFMGAYGLSDSTEILRILDDILSRANTIAIAGTIFMVLSSTNVIRHLEDAFNHIYRARRERPLLYQFSTYIASLVLLPGVLILFAGGVNFFMSRLNPPTIVSLARLDGQIWMTEDHGLSRYTGDSFEKIDLMRLVDRDAPHRDVYFDVKSGRAGHLWEIVGRTTSGVKLESKDFYSLKKIAGSAGNLYVVSERGALFFSKDGGKTWNYNVFAFKNDTEIRRPLLEDAAVMEDGSLLILSTVGSTSCLVIVKDEKYSLKVFETLFNHIFTVDQKRPIKDIHPAGVYMTGTGKYLYSADQGNSWSGPFEEKYGDRSVKITALAAEGDGRFLFGGSDRALWVYRNSDMILPSIRAEAAQNIEGIAAIKGGTILYGSEHLFRFSPDGGETWLIAENEILNEVTFHSHIILPDGSFILSGEDQTFFQGSVEGLSSGRDSEMHPLVRIREIRSIQSPAYLTFTLKAFVSIFLYSLVFLAFTATYRLLPNTVVSWKSAAAGSIVTSIALIAFLTTFRTWLYSFSSTGFIYGIWAIIPVGMLVVLTSTQITLFGLEVTYVVHKKTYAVGPADTGLKEYQLWNSILLLTLVYRKIYRENKPLTDETALEYFQHDRTALEVTRDRLRREGLFSYHEETEEYYPVRPPGSIHLHDLLNAVLRNTLSVPPGNEEIRDEFSEIQKKMNSLISRSTTKLSLQDLLAMMEEDGRIKNPPGR